jgi:hypothetical protein
MPNLCRLSRTDARHRAPLRPPCGYRCALQRHLAVGAAIKGGRTATGGAHLGQIAMPHRLDGLRRPVHPVSELGTERCVGQPRHQPGKCGESGRHGQDLQEALSLNPALTAQSLDKASSRMTFSPWLSLSFWVSPLRTRLHDSRWLPCSSLQGRYFGCLAPGEHGSHTSDVFKAGLRLSLMPSVPAELIGGRDTNHRALWRHDCAGGDTM